MLPDKLNKDLLAKLREDLAGRPPTRVSSIVKGTLNELPEHRLKDLPDMFEDFRENVYINLLAVSSWMMTYRHSIESVIEEDISEVVDVLDDLCEDLYPLTKIRVVHEDDEEDVGHA